MAIKKEIPQAKPSVPAGIVQVKPVAAPVPAELPLPATISVPAIKPMPAPEAQNPLPPVPNTPVQPLSSSDERTWAMLAHLSVLLNLITGLLGPVAAIIIYAVYKDRSRYVAYHAMQSFVNQLIWWVGGAALATVAWTISSALAVVIVGFFCMPFAGLITLMPIVAVVYGIIGGIQAGQGQDFKYWLVGDWTRGTLTG